MVGMVETRSWGGIQMKGGILKGLGHEIEFKFFYKNGYVYRSKM
jgi:hypothetical protein